MLAVISSGGKQYRISQGDTLHVEKINADVGANIEFDKILMINDGENIKIGNPYLKNAKVLAEVLENGRDAKIRIVKFRRRKHFMKQMGHRQYYTKVKITEIQSQ